MSDEELEQFELELRASAPARLPDELSKRLHSATLHSRPVHPPKSRRIANWFDALVGLRWVIAASPLVITAIILVRMEWRPDARAKKSESLLSRGINADAVRVDHSLVSSFDAVAQLPNGEPVRFRCNQWLDNMVVSDDSRGVKIRQSRPRMEVIPVRFETY